MRRFSASMAGSLFCAALLASSGEASANLSMGPAIHSLVQEGQNVEITVVTHPDGLGPLATNDGLRLVREDDGKTVELLDQEVLYEQDAAHVEDVCYGMVEPGQESCEEVPDSCVDCDGDGSAECQGHCRSWYYFEFTDACVPPGDATYFLYISHGDSQQLMDRALIEVDGSVDACWNDLEFGCLLSVPGSTPLDESAIGPLLFAVLAASVAVRRRTG